MLWKECVICSTVFCLKFRLDMFSEVPSVLGDLKCHSDLVFRFDEIVELGTLSRHSILERHKTVIEFIL